MLRFLCLVPKPSGMSPGQRFRLEQWAPVLAAEHGVELEFLPFESAPLTEVLYQPGRRAKKAVWMLYDFARRAASVVRARKFDGVVVYREAALMGPAIYERVFRVARIPMVFDFDDAIWLPQIGANGVFSHLHFFGKTKSICRLASAVTCGNGYLADYARAQNAETHIVPTTIDLADYPRLDESTRRDALVVVWSGSTHTLVHFETARVALERFAKKHPLVVRVVCNRPPAEPIAGAENEFVAWAPGVETRAIADAHVGIMPLPDDEFARGKCGLKALQYMAIGRPAIVSPVGMNADLVTHGESGWLAAGEDAWVSALEEARSVELRKRMSALARAAVEEGYTREQGALKFARAAHRAVG